jgi:hypothetical protein
MSYYQLQQCRKLDRLANELGFDMCSAGSDTNDIELKCREFSVDQDPSGQAVIPYTAWTPYSHRTPIAIGSVTELNMFLLGVQFMKNYVEKILQLEHQVQRAQTKIFQKVQQQVTVDGILGTK